MKSPSHRKPSALDRFCLGAIAWYQRQISPRKGYRCAHARLHGGAGCSGFAREQIARSGLRAAMPLIRARFRDCQLAAQILRAQSASGAPDADEKARAKRDRNRSRNADDGCCVDLSWFWCADSLIDGSACEAASCADASCAESSCAHGACADASCGEAACGCHSCW